MWFRKKPYHVEAPHVLQQCYSLIKLSPWLSSGWRCQSSPSRRHKREMSLVFADDSKETTTDRRTSDCVKATSLRKRYRPSPAVSRWVWPLRTAVLQACQALESRDRSQPHRWRSLLRGYCQCQGYPQAFANFTSVRLQKYLAILPFHSY